MNVFNIDVYSVAGIRENGHTNKIARVQISTRASRVGGMTFTTPTIEYVNAGMATRKWYWLSHKTHGLIGKYRHLSETFNEDDETVTVQCEDALGQLIDATLDFNMSSSNEGITTSLSRVLGRAGWSASLVNNADEFSPVNVDYQGVNVFQGIDSIRQLQRGFFVMSGATALRFGRWTDTLRDSSDYTLIRNVASPVRGTGGIIKSLSIVGTSQHIVNCIVPSGEGTGTTRLDLRRSTRTSPYTIESRANWDGTNTDGTNPAGALTRTYFLKDYDSIARNGEVTRVASFSDIRSLTNSGADLENAANAVYDLAAAYMQQYKDPTTEYQCNVLGLDTLIGPGSVVILDYRGVAHTATGRVSRVFVDKKRFFVVEATHDFDDETGEAVSSLILAANGAKLAEQNDVFTDLLADIGKFKLRPKPSFAPRSDTGPTLYIKPSLPFKHKIRYGAAVLAVNSVKYVFSVTRMVAPATNSTGASSSTTTATAGETTTTSSSSSATTTTSGGGSTTTSSSSSAATTSPVAGTVVYGQVQAGQVGWTGFAWSIGGSSGQFSTGWPNNVGQTAASTGTTGGVVGEGAVISHGGADDYRQHWHDQGGHTHFGDDHTHDARQHYHDVGEHAHGIVHTHTDNNPDHAHGMAHTHTDYKPPHSHGMEHTHLLLFGATADTTGATGISIWMNGVQVTPIRNYDNGQLAGNKIDGEGWFAVDLTARLEAMNDFRQTHDIEIRCEGGRCEVFGKTVEMLTFQPIPVTGNDY